MNPPQKNTLPDAGGQGKKTGRALRAGAVFILLLLVATGIWGWRQGWFGIFTDLEHLRAYILSLGAWGPLAVIAFNMAQAILSPIPGHALNIVSGYLFGPWLGTLYTVIGITGGCAIALGLVRWLGRPFAERLAGKETLARVDNLMQRRGPTFLFWLFLFPFFPDDVICLVAGLTPLPIYQILLLAVVGRTPGLFVANLIGHTMVELTLWQWVIFGVVILLFGALFWRFQQPIETFFVRLAQRFSRSQ